MRSSDSVQLETAPSVTKEVGKQEPKTNAGKAEEKAVKAPKSEKKEKGKKKEGGGSGNKQQQQEDLPVHVGR